MSQKVLNARFWGILAVISIGAAFRLVPHPPNFSPITALALFGGAAFAASAARPGLWAFALPLLALFVSDLFLGFHSMMPVVYGTFALITLLGAATVSERSVVRIGGATIAGSVLFFITTNFAVWMQSGMYEKSLAGLATCYLAALPFLQNALAGDVLFSAVFFGAWALAEKSIPQLRLS